MEIPTTCEDVLLKAHNTTTTIKSQVQKDKRKKMKESTEQRIATEGQHVVMKRKRKLVLPNTSPYSEIDTRIKNTITKAIPKASKLKTHTGKELKDKALRKGKVIEPLEEESLEILSSKDHQT